MLKRDGALHVQESDIFCLCDLQRALQYFVRLVFSLVCALGVDQHLSARTLERFSLLRASQGLGGKFSEIRN